MRWVVAGALALALVGSAYGQTTPLPPSFPSAAVRAYCTAAGDFYGSTTFVKVGQPGPIEWRCSKGAVLICLAGADGINCSARSRRRDPTPEMVHACRNDVDGAGNYYMSVATGAYGYVWQWECVNNRPVIVGPQVVVNLQTHAQTPVVFDDQGYAVSEWTHLR